MNMAKTLAENNVILYIIAPTDVWVKKFYLVKNIHNIQSLKNPLIIDWNAHCIFDISKLPPDERRQFIELLSCEIIKKATSSQEISNKIVIVDECHIPWYNGYFDSNQAQHTKQLLTEGRNFGIRFIAITQSPSTCDKLPIKLAQQRYFFCTSEKEDIDYVKEFVGIYVKDLPNPHPGECIYCYGKPKKIETPKFDETSQLPISRYRSKVTGVISPFLKEAIEEAELIHIGKGRNHYDFLAYSFGEAGAKISGKLIQDITNSLDDLITKSHLKFDYIVSPRYGSRWVWSLAQKRGCNVLPIIERPRKLISELEKRGDETILLFTKLYPRKKVYFRGVKPGDRVIIVDDVISEGRTMRAIIDAMRKHDAEVLGAFCIVAKGNGYKDVEKLGVHVWYLDHRTPL